MQDLIIVEKAVKGDKDAFSQLIHLQEKKLYKIAYMHVKDEQSALDIVGEAVYKAFLNIKKLKNMEYFDTWIVRIVINASMDYLKKNRKTLPLDEALVYLPSADDCTIDLYNSIDKLDPKLKSVIILKYFEDYTINEISGIMECSESNVKNYIHKALGKLRLELREEFGYEGV